MKVKVNFLVTNLQEFEAPRWWEARNWGREIQLSSGRWTPVCDDQLWSDGRLCVHFRVMIIMIIMIVILAVLIMCASHAFNIQTINASNHFLCKAMMITRSKMRNQFFENHWKSGKNDVVEIAWSVSGCLKREGGTKGQWEERRSRVSMILLSRVNEINNKDNDNNDIDKDDDNNNHQ